MNSEIQVAKLQCQTDERNLRDRVNLMTTHISDEEHTSKEDANVVRTYLNQIDESLGEQTKSWNVMKSLPLKPDTLNKVFSKEEEVKKFVSERRLLARAFIYKIDPSTAESKKKAGSDVVYINGSDSKHLEPERMKNPRFSGDIRSFARFKSDFEKILVPAYPDKFKQAYVIKQSCLQGDAKKLVENMDDIDKIWKRLQGRYGDNIEIVNVVIKDIEKFHFTKHEYDQGIINLVDEIEKGVQDLDAINAKHEIANAYTVKLIETKLPRQILTRWLEKESEMEIKE